MSCLWCGNNKYFVMRIPCDHYICFSCLQLKKTCKECKQPIELEHLNKPTKEHNVKHKHKTYEESYVSWYDTMHDYDNGNI